VQCQGRNYLRYILFRDISLPHSPPLLSVGRDTTPTVRLFMSRCESCLVYRVAHAESHMSLGTINRFQSASKYQPMPIRTSRYHLMIVIAKPLLRYRHRFRTHSTLPLLKLRRAPSPSRPPSSSTSTSSRSPHRPFPPSNSGKGSKKNIPAIVGGVIGGLVALGLIGALITFFVLRSKKRKQRAQGYNSGFQQSPNMAFTPNTTASLIPPRCHRLLALLAGFMYVTWSHLFSVADFVLQDPNDPTTYPSTDPSSAHGSYNMYTGPADPYRQHSPFNPNLAPNYTGNSAQNYGPPQTMPAPHPTGRSLYTGAPEL
jgi:hypothetical protein